jgi:uncharacterized coiled-coil protein SlyX
MGITAAALRTRIQRDKLFTRKIDEFHIEVLVPDKIDDYMLDATVEPGNVVLAPEDVGSRLPVLFERMQASHLRQLAEKDARIAELTTQLVEAEQRLNKQQQQLGKMQQQLLDRNKLIRAFELTQEHMRIVASGQARSEPEQS